MRLGLIICLLMTLLPLQARAFTIALVGKTKNDSFYQQSYQGCVAFASQHADVNCIYDGSNDYQDVRTQVLVINDLLKRDIDALLVATTDGDFLVKGALKQAKHHSHQFLSQWRALRSLTANTVRGLHHLKQK